MRAILCDRTRRPARLVLGEVDVPRPRPGEVLVKVAAAAVNAADWRSMDMGIIPKRSIFGADISGRVVSVGPGVEGFGVGDAVAADLSGCGFGGFAEYATAPAGQLSRKPANLGFQDAAALPMAGVTALQALRDKGRVRAGARVLVIGASGGVGGFAVQLAKRFGAEVDAVCSGRHVDLVRGLGADRVIDYSKDDFGGRTGIYDLVLGIHGYRPLGDYLRLLAPSGVAVLVGGSLRQVLPAFLLGGILSLGKRKLCCLAARPKPKDLDLVLDLAARGELRVVTDRVWPLEETAEAMAYARQGHADGKVVIAVDPEIGGR